MSINKKILAIACIAAASGAFAEEAAAGGQAPGQGTFTDYINLGHDHHLGVRLNDSVDTAHNVDSIANFKASAVQIGTIEWPTTMQEHHNVRINIASSYNYTDAAGENSIPVLVGVELANIADEDSCLAEAVGGQYWGSTCVKVYSSAAEGDSFVIDGIYQDVNARVFAKATENAPNVPIGAYTGSFTITSTAGVTFH
jgi:hypothetical protein